MRLERVTPAPPALSELWYVTNTYGLKTETDCVPEQVVTPYLLQCCLEIDTDRLILKDVNTHVYHQSGTTLELDE